MLKPYHHVRVDEDFRWDCDMRITFLTCNARPWLFRPFVDLDTFRYTHTLNFYSDTSKNVKLGLGAIYENHWICAKWGESFVQREDPSIEFLELFALTAAILTWGYLLQNIRIVIFCDNEAVVHMVNNLMSRCPKCMKLIRLLVLDGIVHNRRVFVKHVVSEKNLLADSLSCMQMTRFWKHALSNMLLVPDDIHPSLWPFDKFWYS